MTKQIIIALLVPCLLFYFTGCYSMYDVTKEDLKQNKSLDGNLQVTTNEGESYLFKAFNYIVRKDTLVGVASRTGVETLTPSITKIPLENISVCAINKMNAGVSCLAVLGVIGVALLIYVLIAAHEISEGFFNIGK